MADPSAPPVSPSEGTPTGPSPEETDAYLAKLEAEAEAEKHARMARYVPPSMQEAFLAKNPAPAAYTTLPVDAEDIRQAAGKRGEPAPNEPKEYVNALGEPVDPTKLPEPVAASAAPPAAPSDAPQPDHPQPDQPQPDQPPA